MVLGIVPTLIFTINGGVSAEPGKLSIFFKRLCQYNTKILQHSNI